MKSEHEVDPQMAKMFEEMFGPNKDEVDVNNPVIQNQIKQMASPLPLKLVDSFFKLFVTAFVKVGSIAVIASIIFKAVTESEIKLNTLSNCFGVMITFILPKVIYMLITMGVFWVIIQTMNYLIQFGIVKIYDIQLKKSLKKHKEYVEMIKQNLKAKDDADKNKSETTGGYTAEEIVAHAKEAAEKYRKEHEAKLKGASGYRPAPSLDEFPHK